VFFLFISVIFSVKHISTHPPPLLVSFDINIKIKPTILSSSTPLLLKFRLTHLSLSKVSFLPSQRHH
jgi:hypothetical protein